MSGNENYSRQIVGNYVILEKLGSGEFGSVYRAQNRLIAERVVAIKLINDRYVSSPEECEHFLQEARVLLRLQHPYILPVIDIGEYEGVPYIVLEYSAKGSLQNYLQQQANKIPLEQALTIISQVGQGLHYAHSQNVVHRDLKPDNILFNAKGEAVLADFGIAAELSTSATRNTGTITGTPPYMAPEQFQGIVSRLSDQYALGCIAYELVTGQRPFQAGNLVTWMQRHTSETPVPPRQLNPDLSVAAEQAILRAMAKERMQRFPDVAAFIEALSSREPLPTRVDNALPMLRSSSGQTILGSVDVTIGRTPDNTCVLNDPLVSGHHAVISQQGSGYTIRDLESRNRTFINERVILPQVLCTLQPGDRIRIGGTTFEYINDTVRSSVLATPATVVASPSAFIAPAPPEIAQNVARPLPPTVAAGSPTPVQAYAPPPVLATPGRAGPPPYSTPRKKSRLGLWITLGVAALVVIFGSVALYGFYANSFPHLNQKSYTGELDDQSFGSFAMVLTFHAQNGSSVSGDISLGNVLSTFEGTVDAADNIQFATPHSYVFDGVARLSYSFSGSLSTDYSHMQGNFTSVRADGSAGPSSGTWSVSIPGS